MSTCFSVGQIASMDTEQPKSHMRTREAEQHASCRSPMPARRPHDLDDVDSQRARYAATEIDSDAHCALVGGYTSNHSWQTAALSINSAGVPVKTIRPYPIT
jgi:hypothetical protein